MNGKRTCVILLNWIILTSLCCRSAYAESVRLPEFRASLAKTHLAAGEPAVVRVEVENISLESIPTVFRNIEDFSESAGVTFRVKGSDGARICEEQITPGNGHRIQLLTTNVELKPGRSFHFERMFVPRLNPGRGTQQNVSTQVALPSAGQYELECELSWSSRANENVVLASKGVPFQIIEPTGVDVQAAKLMTLPEVDTFFTGRHGGTPAAIAELMTKYPDSTYARYARLRLTLDRERQIWNTSPGLTPSEMKELGETLSEALSYVDTTQDMGFHDDVLLYSARLARKLGDEIGSIRILKKLIAQYPKGNTAQTAEESLVKWQRTAPLKSEPLGMTHRNNKAWLLLIIAGLVGAGMLCLILLLKRRSAKMRR